MKKNKVRQLGIAAILLFCAVSCTHKKDGWIVKGQDGNLYRLEKLLPNEGYELKKIDSAAINFLK